MITSALMQNRIRERWWGKLHIIIFYTFFIFLISAIELMIQSVWADFSLSFISGTAIAGIIYIIQTYFAWMCFIAVTVLMIRRFVKRKTLRSTFDAWLILGLILCIMMSHFGVISSNIAQNPLFVQFGFMLPAMTGISHFYTNPELIHTISAWIHIVCICIFLIWIPRGKHLHIVMSFPALFSQYRSYLNKKPVTGLDNPEISNYEKMLESALEKDLPEDQWPVIGTEKLTDLSKRQRLEAFACTQCQRCTDVCPMVSAKLDNTSGPMQSVLNLRKLCIDQSNEYSLVPEIISETELWNCTQCGACDRTCGVGVEHTARILKIRQAAVCRENFPKSLNKVFSNFDRNGNPWGYPKAQRLPIICPTDSKVPPKTVTLKIHGIPQKIHTILFFVGCMGYYDQAFNKTVNQFISWLCAQGFEVKTLENEQCCGEAIRKLGNESAFDKHMRQNLELIQQTSHDLILSACPHCAQVLGNDYVTDQTQPIVMHAWEFLAQLSKEINFEFDSHPKNTAVLHMPCLLGKQPESPTLMLQLARHANITVIDKDVARSHCCGAGGGQFFMDTHRSVTEQRARELLSNKPQTIVTACPFCHQMLKDEVLRQAPNHAPNIVQILDLLS